MKDKEVLKIDKNKLAYVRKYLINEVFRNPNCVFDDNIRGYDGFNPDLIDIICDLYEYLHVLLYNEPYDYMFHWANKVGGWVDTGLFDDIIIKEMMEDEQD
jgi:hypothetical protein